MAAERLREARACEEAGRYVEAIAAYEVAIHTARRADAPEVLSAALRHLAVLHHHRDDVDRAHELVREAIKVAASLPNALLAGEALNTQGGLYLTGGHLDKARHAFTRALETGGASRKLRAKIEQNLGIIANIQGRLYEALTRYESSLAAYRAVGDEHGCAIAYHNMGRVSVDRGHAEAADTYYRECLQRAERSGDVYLQGLCLVSQADLDVSRQRYENARQRADAALALFARLGARGSQSGAHRVLGMVYRETGKPQLAEAQFRAAIELAVSAGEILSEADSSRELAALYQVTNRNQEALLLLNTAYRLYRRLDARQELVNVRARLTTIETAYLSVVRSWGRTLNARDTNAAKRCERVLRHSLMAARMLGLDEQQQTSIMIGTHLHDLGMIRVPQKMLRKPGALSAEELRVMQRHPIWGLELLGPVELPWDIKPIIRWHHERCDGSGYPDGLSGDSIPFTAQIVGLFDAYDAMLWPRPYQRRMTSAEAVEQLVMRRAGWSKPVFDTFLRIVNEPAPVTV